MRHEESQDQSCVTIEYSLEQKRVKQKYAAYNNSPEREQLEIIDKWEKYMRHKQKEIEEKSNLVANK